MSELALPASENSGLCSDWEDKVHVAGQGLKLQRGVGPCQALQLSPAPVFQPLVTQHLSLPQSLCISALLLTGLFALWGQGRD